jgi:hypothetical protein
VVEEIYSVRSLGASSSKVAVAAAKVAVAAEEICWMQSKMGLRLRKLGAIRKQARVQALVAPEAGTHTVRWSTELG